jgi:hypothetical protein
MPAPRRSKWGRNTNRTPDRAGERNTGSKEQAVKTQKGRQFTFGTTTIMTHIDPQSDGDAQSATDVELEQLVFAALEAPPVPRSLLKRIDLGVQAEWGIHPGLADRPLARFSRGLAEGTGAFRRRNGWARALPTAAVVGLVIALGVIFSTGRRGYAWADVLEAIARQGILQIEGPETLRWLSLNEGIIGEQNDDVSQLIDLRQNVVLTRTRGDSTIRRFRTTSDASAVSRDQLLLGFLMGDVPGNSRSLAGLRLVEDSWTAAAGPAENHAILRARFESESGDIIVRLTLNPDTLLPQRCEVDAAGTVLRQMAVSYPEVGLQELRDRQFPPQLAVLEVDGPIGSLTSTAQETARAVVLPAAPTAEQTDAARANPADVAADGATDDAETGAATATLLAAASRWAPVEVPEVAGEDVVQQVDAVLERLWIENGVKPTFAATDEKLLRRVYLDLAGRTPSVHEVQTYLKDKSTNRYEQLVDRLLQSPDHASHLATVWRSFLLPEGVDLSPFGGVAAFEEWLAEQFASGEPYDGIVRNLLLAEGRLSRSGPLLFYSATKLDPELLAARTARVFLGMRLECAQCHDHPFEDWTQQDFWSYAAFFAQISRPQTELENVSRVMRVRDIERGEVMLPETETVVAPQFLDGTELEQGAPRRSQLAQWMTAAENPYFARATANRVWGQMFGKGIIDPVDDFGEQHPPKSPELLDLLAGNFIASGFDLRQLFRTVALSRAYRLSSGADSADDARLESFAQMHVKTLSAEQVYDCISVAAMLDAEPTIGAGSFSLDRVGNAQRNLFLQQFRTPAGQVTEYLGGIPQALTLMNGTLIKGATGISSSGLLKSLEAPFFTNEQRIEVLYMATLSRRPRESEWELLNEHIPEDASGERLIEGLADLLWALLNTAEFTMNH